MKLRRATLFALVSIALVSGAVGGAAGLLISAPPPLTSYAQSSGGGGQQLPAGYSLIPPGTVMETLPSGALKIGRASCRERV